MRPLTTAMSLGLASVLIAAAALADVVELKTGQRIEGTLTQATSASVVIEVGGQTITFTTDKVRAIYFGGAPKMAAPPANEASLSPEFREKAQRALDAIERVPVSLSRREMTPVNQNLLIEADKAVADAKYKAKTALDTTVLRALQMAVISMKGQGAYDAADPGRNSAWDRASQCRLEATLHIAPKALSRLGAEQAKLATCNKKTEKWSEGITR